jgi:serine/threonine protein kinase
MSSPDPDDERTVIRPSGGHPAEASSSAGSSGNALPVGTYIAEFEISSVIGEGGFGIVYGAWDHSLQRRVALKEYMPATLAARATGIDVRVRSERHHDTFTAGLKSFIKEARMLAQFDHPSLVKVYRFWEDHGTAYMVMPLYEGVTLRDKLRALDAPPDEAWLRRLLDPLTEALAVIHADDCLHRDIAPDNIILLAGSEEPLLVDFGAARKVIGDATQSLTVILKQGYAPVEQYAEVPGMKQGPWTDIYALAASVHFAIMGKTPPPSVSRLLHDSFVPLRQSAAGRYSDAFLDAIDRALQVKPDARTSTAAALRTDLGMPPPGHATAAAAPRPPRVAPDTEDPRASRKGWLVGVSVLALVVAAGLGIAWYGGESGVRSPTTTTTAASPAGGSAVPGQAGPDSGPAAAASPPVRTFEIRDEFDRVLTGQWGGYEVKAAPFQRQFRIGQDQLGFTVISSRDGYVHVLALGPDGSLRLLFPNAQASDNRIGAGQLLTLPQPSWPLNIAEPAGPEEFLVIVSDQPRDYSGLSSEREYFFLKLPTGQQGADAAAAWTRSTPILLGSLRACPSADCEAYGAASFTIDIVH